MQRAYKLEEMTRHLMITIITIIIIKTRDLEKAMAPYSSTLA